MLSKSHSSHVKNDGSHRVYLPRLLGSGPGAEPPLGNLRDTYAEAPQKGGKNPSKIRPKQESGEGAKTDRLVEKFALQRTSGRLLPSMRVANCIWTSVGNHVDVLRRGVDVRFGGVQTCGSWSACPICSARIAEVRRQELRQLEEWAGSPKRGLRMIMMTLTARHRKRALKSLVERMSKAKARMQNRKGWKSLRVSGVLAGSVSVREATYGAKNGWHPHYHVLLLIRADSDEEALALLEPIREVWLECLRKEGLSGTAERAFHLQSGDAVAAYISKHGRDQGDRKAAEAMRSGWGMAEEMTQSRAKRGRGDGPEQSRSPFQLLRDAHEGDVDAAKLWQEYAIVMWGKRQQVWSNGLKQAVGLLDTEDETIAAGEEYTPEEDELLHQFDKPSWHRWRPFRAEILAAARNGGADGLAAYLSADPQQHDDRVLIDDDIAESPLPHNIIRKARIHANKEAVRDQDFSDLLAEFALKQPAGGKPLGAPERYIASY